MYQGSNPTAIRSQRTFLETMMKMLKRKDYSQINVQDICRKAGLSRQTFYQFFESKEELTRELIRENLQSLREKTADSEDRDLEEQIRMLIAYTKTNNSFISIMYDNGISFMYQEELTDCIGDMIAYQNPESETKSGRIANSFLAGALASTLLTWSRGVRMSEDGLVKLLLKILKGRYFRL